VDRAGRWERGDLVRRVSVALDVAAAAIAGIELAEGGAANGARSANGAHGAVGAPPPEKLVAETAMLLLCAAPLGALSAEVADRIDAVAAPLVALARDGRVLAAICSDPGRAREHALAHTILSRLGHVDPEVDDLLRQSLAVGRELGPERLEHRRLEGEWLDRVWTSGAAPQRPERGLLARSALGRPIDALGATRLDLYAFTHALMYATDFGGRRVAMPRSRTLVAADAEAGLALALETGDLDLTTELCLTWPLLGRPWSPAAAFAFGVLASAEDKLGFLPGLRFDRALYGSLGDEGRQAHALETSYHPTYVMGFLCAIAVRSGVLPPASVPAGRRHRGAGPALLSLTVDDDAVPGWIGPASALDGAAQDAIAPLILVAILRRARTRGDLALLRTALELAVRHDLLRGPAPGQAAGLLRRSVTLDRLTGRSVEAAHASSRATA
jgi:hypothetical protein